MKIRMTTITPTPTKSRSTINLSKVAILLDGEIKAKIRVGDSSAGRYYRRWRELMPEPVTALSWLTWLRIMGVSGATGIAASTAASKWLGKYWLEWLLAKHKAEYDQELEHYRAQLDRSVFVTRAHFETEYTAMKEVAQRFSKGAQ
jgi:hypothetical protein